MKEFQTILYNIADHVALVMLNRPDKHNAINDIMIEELIEIFLMLKEDPDIRVIILTGNGKSFCSGADLQWMKSVVNNTFEENYNESLRLAKLLELIYTHPKPTIARVNGAAFGGGIGLLAACDMAYSTETAEFAFSEARLGLVPAVISPYIIKKIGEGRTKEMFITAERIGALTASDYGLINSYHPMVHLDTHIDRKIGSLKKNGPQSISKIKELVNLVSDKDISEIQSYTANLIANLRISEEGQEGMDAFFKKRDPYWLLVNED